MKKFVKKFFKITGITLVILLALMIILPIVFKGKIMEQVKVAINQHVNGTVDFDDFRLSFFRSFPDVSFRLDGLSVVGVEPFEGEPLAEIGSIYVSVNLMSLFGDSGYEIKTIRIDDPVLSFKVLADGTANWDIVKESEIPIPDEDTEEEEDAEPLAFQVALRQFQIRNAHVVFDDRSMNMYARIQNFNHTLRGDFTADFTSIAIRNTTIESLLVRYEGVPYLNNVFAEFTADIDADLNAFEFTFRDNSFRLNDLMLVFDGSFGMPGEDMVMDFTFSSPQTAFKSFLSLVPAVYAQDFDGLETDGTLGFGGFVKGVFSEESIPGFGLRIDVENGMFQYPDLPAAVTDVQIKTRIDNPGGDIDFTVVDVSKFSLNVGGNPVDFRLNLRTPVSDPQIDAMLKGVLDLGKVKDFYPLEAEEQLAGVIQSDIVARGRLSSIENQRYNEFVFTGQFSVNDLHYASADFPDGVQIPRADLRFSPQFVQLRTFELKMGPSDISANGRIDNILGFALNDEMLSGRFETYSSHFDLNPFMVTTEDEPVVEEGEPVELAAIEVPGNINFSLQSRFDRLLFGDLEITNITGGIMIADQAVKMNNLRMHMLGGNMVLNGSYTARDIEHPEIAFGLQISNFDIGTTFHTFNTFATIAPLGERASGRFSAGFDLNAVLDHQLQPDLNTLAGGGNFRSSAIEIENSPALVSLAENLRMDRFRKFNVRDVALKFAFANGRVEVEPFDISFGNSIATISGNHGFDQSINYLMNMSVPRAEFGGAANQVLDNLVGQAAGRGLNITPGETVHMGVAITGTVTEPSLSVRLSETTGDVRQQMMDALEDAVMDVLDDVKDRAKEEVEQVKEQAREELEKRAQQVVADAEAQAARIRREAKSSADAIRQEARAQAKKLEDEASGPVAKTAARRTGQEMIRNADRRADDLEKEADNRASQLEKEAQERAKRIRAGEE